MAYQMKLPKPDGEWIDSGFGIWLHELDPVSGALVILSITIVLWWPQSLEHFKVGLAHIGMALLFQAHALREKA